MSKEISLSFFRNPALAKDPNAHPEIQITPVIRDLARAIRDNIPLTEELFFLGGNLCTITAERKVSAGGHQAWTKKTVQMTPSSFVSWVEKYVSFYSVKADGTKVYKSLTRGQAELVLASEEFQRATPNVNEILHCRLPVRKTENGKLIYALADKGYTVNQDLFTFDNSPIFDEIMREPEQLRKFFELEFGDFAFEGVISRGDFEPPDMSKSRNAAMTVACILGQYLRNLMRLFPLIIVNANTQGCGKSWLAQAILYPFYGSAANTTLPDNEEERRKTLASCALSGDPYIFFDNQTTIASNALEGAITSVTLSGRQMHSYSNYETANRMQLITTGNHIKVNKDIERRAAFIDMAYNGPLDQRTYRNPLTADKMESRQWQRIMLTWCDNAYRSWLDAGQPKYCHPSDMPSFNDFVELAGNITMHLGFCNPFRGRAQDNSGDVRSAAFLEFLQFLASRYLPANPDDSHTTLRVTFDTEQLLTFANDQKRTSTFLPDTADKKSAIGQRIARIQGNYMTDLHGRQFRFVKQGNAKYRQEYLLEIMTEPTQLGNLPLAHAQAINPDAQYTDPIYEITPPLFLNINNQPVERAYTSTL